MFGITKKEKQEKKRLEYMTNEQATLVDGFLSKIQQRVGEMQDQYERWEKEQEAYSGSQDIVDDAPNSRVNIVNANIEGQVAMVCDQNMAVMTRGTGPSDQGFATFGRVGLDWTLRKNNIKKVIDRHERRRLLFGTGIFKTVWNPDAIKGFGLWEIKAPGLNSVVVDGMITDYEMDLEQAEYIAEFMPMSVNWAKAEFGDMALNIKPGSSPLSAVFNKLYSQDDENIFWYVQLWCKTDGMLRLIEFSDDGVLLSDSFMEWDGKKFKELKNPQPYYRINKYPYFFTNEYYEEGQPYGFGDGKLLRPLQDMINDLYDQIRRAARPNRVFFDPASDVDLEDIDANDGAVPAINPNNTIRVVDVGQVNPALWQLLNNIHLEVQRVTRFSELMLGNSTRSQTATEANIQQQQGSSGIDHKKGQLEQTLVKLCEYILEGMIEKYDSGRAFRLDENKDDFQWIDFRQLDKVPVMVPASDSMRQQFQKDWPDREAPKFEILKDDNGEEMTKSVELDIEVTIGAGMPKNKSFIWQMAERLAPLVVEGQPLIHYPEMRKFLRDLLGIPLDAQFDQLPPPQMPMPGQADKPKDGMPMQGADTAGQSPGGQPMATMQGTADPQAGGLALLQSLQGG